MLAARKSHQPSHATSLASAFLIGAIAASPAAAQNDHTLFNLIWPQEQGEHWAQTYDQILLLPGGHLQATDEDFDLFYWDSYGRVRLDRADSEPDFFLGYRILTMAIGGDDLPALPGDLNDVSVTGAFRFGEDDQDWRMSLLGGIGSANDGHWSDSDALYGIGAIDFEHVIDSERTLHIGVEYHGNRTYVPDVPLPYVSFEDRLGENVWYRVGFPQCALRWDIDDRFSLESDWTLAQRLKATLSADVSDACGVFLEFERTIDGFHTEDAEHDRLFYEFSRVSTGVRWKSKWIDAQIGVGWAFDQAFTSGFDLRHTDDVTEASDNLMIVATLRGTF